jgi:predicted molibdopterin-dependent oxidoreductase YjgC
MFKRIQAIKKPVKIRFEDQDITAEIGDSVAAALLAAGVIVFRETDKQEARGPYCMIGNCFECLVEIDGVPNQQACQVLVQEGMQVKTQRGLTRLEVNHEI